MSKKHPLWAIQRPDGTIIQESVVYMNKDAAWIYVVELDKKCAKIVNDAAPTDLDDEFFLKKAGYKLVKVVAVLKEK